MRVGLTDEEFTDDRSKYKKVSKIPVTFYDWRFCYGNVVEMKYKLLKDWLLNSGILNKIIIKHRIFDSDDNYKTEWVTEKMKPVIIKGLENDTPENINEYITNYYTGDFTFEDALCEVLRDYLPWDDEFSSDNTSFILSFTNVKDTILIGLGKEN